MKYLLPAAALLLALANKAQAQADYEKLEPTELNPVMKKVPLYRSPKDTVKAVFYLPSGQQAVVIGRVAPKFAVVKLLDYTYYVPTRYLDNFSSVPGTPAMLDRVDKLPQDAQGNIGYSDAVPVEGVAKNELYARGKVWFANAFRSAQNVIQADDKDAGVLVGKGIALLNGTDGYQPTLRFTVKLSFRDGRYRYEFSDFRFQNAAATAAPTETSAEQELAGEIKPNGKPNRKVVEKKTELNHQVKVLVRHLQAAMTKPATGSDW